MAKPKVKTAVIDKNDLYEHLNNIKDALAETTDGVKSRASELVADLLDDIQDRRHNYREAVTEFVTDKPFKALGLAIALGISIGKIL